MYVCETEMQLGLRMATCHINQKGSASVQLNFEDILDFLNRYPAINVGELKLLTSWLH